MKQTSMKQTWAPPRPIRSRPASGMDFGANTPSNRCLHIPRPGVRDTYQSITLSEVRPPEAPRHTGHLGSAALPCRSDIRIVSRAEFSCQCSNPRDTSNHMFPVQFLIWLLQPRTDTDANVSFRSRSNI